MPAARIVLGLLDRFRLAAVCLLLFGLVLPMAAPALSAAKPVLAVRMPASNSNANRMLYDKLRTAARNRLTRFQVIEGAVPGADLVVVVEFLLEPTVEINRKARTEEVERKDSSGKTVKDTRIVESVEYTCNGEADVRITDGKTGTEDVLHVVKTGTSHSSTGDAREEVYAGIVREVLDALRNRHRLEATVTRKDGRTVHLDRGSDVGIEPEGFFAALSSGGREIGEVRVDRVEGTSSVGRIRAGFYEIAPGTRLVERVGGGTPRGLSIGFVNRLAFGPSAGGLEQSYLGVEGHLMQANPDGWFDLAAEADYLTHGNGTRGFAFFGSLIPQVEVIPEWLWLHLPLGAGFEVYLPPFGTTGTAADATATGLHLLAGVGATIATPVGLRLSADGGFLSPWGVSGWRVGSGFDAVTVTGLPTFTVGGLYGKWSLTWGF